MKDITLSRMHEIQRELQEKYKEKWGGLSPKVARDQLLWMMIEAGEAADIIKKEGDTAIMENKEARGHFIEELCDVMMYLNDVMLCYSVTPEELATAYEEKHRRNMTRW